jgi:hypothetical protein
MRGISADLAFKARRITAIDGDHIGGEGEIGDENDLRLRFGAGDSGLEAVVNSAAAQQQPGERHNQASQSG